MQSGDWSSDVCSSDLTHKGGAFSRSPPEQSGACGWSLLASVFPLVPAPVSQSSRVRRARQGQSGRRGEEGGPEDPSGGHSPRSSQCPPGSSRCGRCPRPFCLRCWCRLRSHCEENCGGSTRSLDSSHSLGRAPLEHTSCTGTRLFSQSLNERASPVHWAWFQTLYCYKTG